MDVNSSGSSLTANFDTTDELSGSNGSQLVVSIVLMDAVCPPKFYPHAIEDVTTIHKTKTWNFHYSKGLKYYAFHKLNDDRPIPEDVYERWFM
jgi:hypothetical protein